jgi:hypothetical protein
MLHTQNFLIAPLRRQNQGSCSRSSEHQPQKKHAGLKARSAIYNAINNPINGPKCRLKAKEAKGRLIFGCTFAGFLLLSPEEQQRRPPGFKEINAMALAVNDARSAEERKKFNRAAVKQMEVTSSVTLQTALAKAEPQFEEALSFF